ncbi:MAG: hypothetical protein KJ000_18375 [Pirellulaceae bacterium]|nr:hypothetical protein [Pirellulaceae bacterium]
MRWQYIKAVTDMQEVIGTTYQAANELVAKFVDIGVLAEDCNRQFCLLSARASGWFMAFVNQLKLTDRAQWADAARLAGLRGQNWTTCELRG